MIFYKKNIVFLFVFIIYSGYFLLQAESQYKVVVLDRNDIDLVNKTLLLFENPKICSCLSVSIDDLSKRLRSKSYFFLLVQDDQGMVLGALPYYMSSNLQDVWIYTIATHPDYQHKGIGTMLLKHLGESVGEKPIHTSFLASNIKIHNLLKKLGYVQTDYFIKLEMLVVKDDIIMMPQDNTSRKVLIQFLDSDNEQQVSQFCNLFHKDEIGFYGPADIQKKVLRNKELFLCAIIDGSVIGGLIVTPNIKSCEPSVYGWELSILAVDKSYRRQGIASQLILACQQRAAQEHIDRLLITVRQDNSAAYNCYKKLGFIEKDAICNMQSKNM